MGSTDQTDVEREPVIETLSTHRYSFTLQEAATILFCLAVPATGNALWGWPTIVGLPIGIAAAVGLFTLALTRKRHSRGYVEMQGSQLTVRYPHTKIKSRGKPVTLDLGELRGISMRDVAEGSSGESIVLTDSREHRMTIPVRLLNDRLRGVLSAREKSDGVDTTSAARKVLARLSD